MSGENQIVAELWKNAKKPRNKLLMKCGKLKKFPQTGRWLSYTHCTKKEATTIAEFHGFDNLQNSVQSPPETYRTSNGSRNLQIPRKIQKRPIMRKTNY